jgi:uncharacterized protein YcgI (DUF1989 family)
MPDVQSAHPSNEVISRHTVRARQFVVVDVDYGQTLRLTDRSGGSAAQLLLSVAGDQRDRFSAPNTAVLNKTIYLSSGGVLYSYFYQPMMTITEDTVGGHSMLPTPLRASAEVEDPDSQLGLGVLDAAAAELGVKAGQAPFPFQAFVHHVLSDTGAVSQAASRSRVGDTVALVADLDLRAVIVNNPALVGQQTTVEESVIEVSLSQTATEE